MAFTIERDSFASEEEALETAKAAGYFAATLDRPASDVGDHWHEFNTMVFVLEREITITDSATGETHRCGPGTRFSLAKGDLHREKTDGYKAVIAIDKDPSTLTEPIDKPPVE